MPANLKKALYFPTISLPKESAIASAILYWDKLYSVVPYEHVQRPDELLSPFMQELSAECGVNHLVPCLHLHEVPDFGERFIGFLERSSTDHGNSFHTHRTVRIHAEKLLEIPEYLVNNGWATKGEGEWYLVNAVVADYFMAYLALSLGSLRTINATPFTTSSHLAGIIGGAQVELQSIDDLKWQERVRLAVLPEIDIEGLDLNRLMAFKREHASSARQLRGEAERILGKILLEKTDARKEEAFQDYLSRFTRRVHCFEREAAEYSINMSSNVIMPTLGAGLSFAASLEGSKIAAAGAAISFLAMASDAVKSIHRKNRITREYGGAVTFVAGVRRNLGVASGPQSSLL
ncbi:hypothetical protein [Marinobacter nauticus]|uniref:hypothetical protein n=1 Tax=Marinobacter nauticus TaxID=2743 RepID=UPI001CD6FF14|nr:hypothetical protein [Marinobacter nauticus]MCA0912818.1 hypothetical protein [Marinobacter nauticus]